MEVVQSSWGPLLHCALPCSPGNCLFFSPTHFLFLSHTDTCKHTCLCVHHNYSPYVNGNPGNLLTSPSGTFDHHSLILRRWSPVSHLSPVHSFICPLVSSMCSVHLNQFRAHSYSHGSSSDSSSCTLIITLFSAEILLLVSSPFCYQTHHVLIEQSSVFRDKCISHIFTVITRCWHAGILFSLSQLTNNCSTSTTAADSSVQTSVSRSLMIVGGEKTITSEVGPETQLPVYYSVSLK